MTTTPERTSRTEQVSGLLASTEQRTIEFIPDSDRHGKVVSQGIFWFLSNLQPLSVAIGFLGVTLGLSIGWTVVALVLGTLFGTALMALHTSQGPHLGLPQMLQSRAQFGYRGVSLALIAALTSFLAYVILDAILLALGFDSQFGVPRTATVLVSITIAVLLATLGYDWLHVVFKWALWISVPLWILLTAGIVLGLGDGAPGPAHLGFSFAAFATVFAYTASINFGYAVNVSDYSRYLPRDTSFKAVVLSTYAGAAVSLIWLASIGAWAAARLNATDGLAAIREAGDNIATGLGTLLALVSSFVLIFTIGEVLYSGALTLLTTISSFRAQQEAPTASGRALAAVGLGLVGLVVALLTVDRGQTTIYDLIYLVFYVLIPWSAVNLVDYFVVRRGRYAITDLFRPDGIYGAWSARGLIAYVAGLLAVVPFVQLSFWTGFLVAKVNHVDVSYLSGLLVAGIVYWALSRSLDKDAHDRAVDESHAELERLGLVSPAEDALESQL